MKDRWWTIVNQQRQMMPLMFRTNQDTAIVAYAAWESTTPGSTPGPVAKMFGWLQGQGWQELQVP